MDVPRHRIPNAVGNSFATASTRRASSSAARSAAATIHSSYDGARPPTAAVVHRIPVAKNEKNLKVLPKRASVPECLATRSLNDVLDSATNKLLQRWYLEQVGLGVIRTWRGGVDWYPWVAEMTKCSLVAQVRVLVFMTRLDWWIITIRWYNVIYIYIILAPKSSKWDWFCNRF